MKDWPAAPGRCRECKQEVRSLDYHYRSAHQESCRVASPDGTIHEVFRDETGVGGFRCPFCNKPHQAPRQLQDHVRKDGCRPTTARPVPTGSPGRIRIKMHNPALKIKIPPASLNRTETTRSASEARKSDTVERRSPPEFTPLPRRKRPRLNSASSDTPSPRPDAPSAEQVTEPPNGEPPVSGGELLCLPPSPPPEINEQTPAAERSHSPSLYTGETDVDVDVIQLEKLELQYPDDEDDNSVMLDAQDLGIQIVYVPDDDHVPRDGAPAAVDLEVFKDHEPEGRLAGANTPPGLRLISPPPSPTTDDGPLAAPSHVGTPAGDGLPGPSGASQRTSPTEVGAGLCHHSELEGTDSDSGVSSSESASPEPPSGSESNNSPPREPLPPDHPVVRFLEGIWAGRSPPAHFAHTFVDLGYDTDEQLDFLARAQPELGDWDGLKEDLRTEKKYDVWWLHVKVGLRERARRCGNNV